MVLRGRHSNPTSCTVCRTGEALSTIGSPLLAAEQCFVPVKDYPYGGLSSLVNLASNFD